MSKNSLDIPYFEVNFIFMFGKKIFVLYKYFYYISRNTIIRSFYGSMANMGCGGGNIAYI
jgi:hypothetical protein